jgi:predicted acyl esterase
VGGLLLASRVGLMTDGWAMGSTRAVGDVGGGAALTAAGAGGGLRSRRQRRRTAGLKAAGAALTAAWLAVVMVPLQTGAAVKPVFDAARLAPLGATRSGTSGVTALSASALGASALGASAAPSPRSYAGTAVKPAVAPPAPVTPQAGVHCPLGLTVSAHLDPGKGLPSTVCSGYVTSFDGTPLSTDVTIPDGTRGALPLVVMLHGWGDNKSNFEAGNVDGNQYVGTYHWNNIWFASQGFAVLTYTARGFWHSCGKVPVSGAPSAGGITASDPVYLTEAGCAGRESWTHLSDRRWEVRDTQALVGKLVDAGVADPAQIVVTGNSYGGGESWLLAMSQDRVMRRNGTTEPWVSPKGVPIHLAAAVPLYGWTDLVQALVDNGGAAIAQAAAAGSPPASSHASPYGVEKLSYVSGLFAVGEATAQYALPGADPTADLTTWFAGVGAGEPYSADPIVAQAVDQLDAYRSAWYMPVPPPRAQVPVFSVQGVTDPLFPATQSLQMEQRLRAAYPNYPVWTVLADVGHSYADNPGAVWKRIDEQANRWLDAVLHHQRPAQPKIEVPTVACLSGQKTTWLSADHLRQLADQVLVFTSPATATTASAAANTVEDSQIDPIANSGCRTLPTSQADPPGTASFTFAVPSSASAGPPGDTVTLLGAPVVRADAVLLGHNAELAASLWVVDAATGQQTLVTRSVRRLEGTPGQTLHLAFELWPTAWPIPAGDQLQLQLTQNDAPTWRPDNEPSSLVISHLELRLPILGSR